MLSVTKYNLDLSHCSAISFGFFGLEFRSLFSLEDDAFHDRKSFKKIYFTTKRFFKMFVSFLRPRLAIIPDANHYLASSRSRIGMKRNLSFIHSKCAKDFDLCSLVYHFGFGARAKIVAYFKYGQN